MDARIRRLFVLSGACVVSILAGTAAGQVSGSPPQAAPDGFVRSEVSLGVGRSVVATFAPAAVSGAAGAPVASLQLDGVARFGTLELGKASVDSRYDLRLDRTGDPWQLDVTDAGSKADVGRVALVPQQGSRLTRALAVALVPTAADAAQFVLRWNGQEAAANLQFVTAVSQESSRRPPNQPVSRRHFEARAEVRAQILSQRNLTTLAFADGRSLSLSSMRGASNVDGPDFAGLASAADGALIELTRSAVPSLKTDAPLRFGGRTLAAGNVAPDFHGSYGLWLKRAGDGWRLVFNHQADVWGTQHDAEADAMEIELTHSQDGDAARPFGAALVATGNERGNIVLHWGPHTWSAEFQVGASQ